MSAVILSDVHADVAALSAMRDCIADPRFAGIFGKVDLLVNLGDLLHRGDHPMETLEIIQALSRTYRLVSVLGNHDHAYLNRLAVSGSDAASLVRHEQLRGSPLLSVFDGMPMEWVEGGILFVHGGPMEMGTSTLRLKCWQRLGREAGDSFAGYNYTPEMAFAELGRRGLSHLCCGHQHTSICYRRHPLGIQECWLDYAPAGMQLTGGYHLEAAQVGLEYPAILRIGACCGKEPEFAVTDFRTFRFLRLS